MFSITLNSIECIQQKLTSTQSKEKAKYLSKLHRMSCLSLWIVIWLMRLRLMKEASSRKESWIGILNCKIERIVYLSYTQKPQSKWGTRKNNMRAKYRRSKVGIKICRQMQTITISCCLKCRPLIEDSMNLCSKTIEDGFRLIRCSSIRTTGSASSRQCNQVYTLELTCHCYESVTVTV